MKIGIVTEYFYPTLGGITENIYHFSKELLRGGHDVRIVTGFFGEPTEIDPNIRDRIIFLGRSIPIFYNKSCARVTVGTNLSRRMRELLKQERFDLIHVHSPMFPTLPVVATLQADVPVVGTFHTCTGTDLLYYRLFRGRARKVLDRMAGRIAVSASCARENERAFGRSFDIIPNGVDTAWWSGGRRIGRFDDGKANILFLGRPDFRNGLDTVISAFAHLHRRHPATRLIVVGDGPLGFHFRNAVPRDTLRAVHFEGAQNGSRPDYAATADIFCFLPDIAACSITVLEGMAAGRAIITSDIAPIRAVLKEGEEALLVPPRDEIGLVSQMERLIEDEPLRLKLGAAAARRVVDYDWRLIAERHLEHYRHLLNH